MLLSQPFKTGGVAASTLGGPSRSNALVAKTSVVRKMSTKLGNVSASASGGGSESTKSPGWLESKIGKVTSYVDKKLHGDGKAGVPEEMMEMTGTAIVVKKLFKLDVVDRIADARDDVSELLQGKHVSIQLMSNEIDPSTFLGSVPRQSLVVKQGLLLGVSVWPNCKVGRIC